MTEWACRKIRHNQQKTARQWTIAEFRRVSKRRFSPDATAAPLAPFGVSASAGQRASADQQSLLLASLGGRRFRGNRTSRRTGEVSGSRLTGCRFPGLRGGVPDAPPVFIVFLRMCFTTKIYTLVVG